jgi:hypothetical protein
LAYGSAVHKAFEFMNNAEKASLIDVYQSFHDAWHKEMNSMGLKTEDYYNEKLYLSALTSVQNYYADFYKTYELTEYVDKWHNVNSSRLSTECEFFVPIIYPDGTKEEEYVLHGLIDVIGIKNKKIFILDYKTAKEDYTPFKVKTSLQLSIYAYAFRQMLKMGIFPQIKKEIEDYTTYHILIKSTNEITQKKKIVTDHDINKMLYMIKTFKRGVDSQVFMPNYQDNCKWCSYQKECLAFSG